jgi:molybdenum cofactor synthesis domain-containing protein
MAPRLAESAAVLVIGNELLSGKVHEANLIELAKTLRALGIALRRVVMIPDDRALIASEVRALASTHDIVFTSGGVGPTHDDITLESVADAFGVAASIHEGIANELRAAYGERCTDAHLRMALVPEGAELVTGADVSWPTVVMKNVWVLPGVPEIFRMKLAVVREHVRGSRPFFSKAVFARLDEGALKPWLDAVVEAHPSVDVGSYPKWFDASYKTKVTFDGRDAADVERAVTAFLELIPADQVARVE